MKIIGQVQIASAILLIGCVLGRALPARAGLGGDQALIESDASALGGKMSQPVGAQSSEQSTAYTVTSFVTGNAVTVREYSARSGPVFGVAWQGRRPPDLKVLLGSYYLEYVAASKAHKGALGLHHAIIEGPNSIVFLNGRMGRITGSADVPSLAPSGVDAKAVVK